MPVSEEITINHKLQAHICMETVSPKDAFRLLISTQRQLCTSAHLNDDGTVALTHFEVFCPNCGSNYTCLTDMAISNSKLETIQAWRERQFSLFEDKHLSICDEMPKKSVCPHCGFDMDAEGQSTKVQILREKSKIIVRSEILDLDTIMKLPYLPDHSFYFPMYEQVEFNLRKGRVCVRCFSFPGKFIGTMDITNSPNVLASCVIHDLFHDSKPLRAALLRAYEDCAGGKALFSADEITLTDFVYLTRFIGFSVEFYRAIPYDKRSLSIDNSFRDICKLHSTGTAATYLQGFSFAQAPSVRKCIGTHQPILFYLPECETLFQAIKDVNLFRAVLESRDILELLHLLHQKPNTITFFADYCSEIGASKLCRFLCSQKVFPYDWSYYAAYYSELNRYGQAFERKEWHKTRLLDYLRKHDSHSTSLPMASNALPQANSVIDGFIFKVAQNTAECFAVGKKLRNCLQSWMGIDSVIVSVQYANEIVAAVEIQDGDIAQAFSKDNNSISAVPNLKLAIKKWAAKNKVTYS